MWRVVLLAAVATAAAAAGAEMDVLYQCNEMNSDRSHIVRAGPGFQVPRFDQWRWIDWENDLYGKNLNHTSFRDGPASFDSSIAGNSSDEKAYEHSSDVLLRIHGESASEGEIFEQRKNYGGVIGRARTYADVNAKRHPSVWNYDLLFVRWRKKEHYEVTERIGGGVYSRVYEALDMRDGKKVVLKCLRPVKSHRIRRELAILQTLCGGPNIIKLLDVFIHPEAMVPTFAMEHIDAGDFYELVHGWNHEDTRYYMYQMLKALDYAHSNGIMHRDIKPDNIVIDHKERKLRIIDWGLGEFYHPYKEYNLHVASRYWKGPELTIDLEDYDYSLDMWSIGCVFAEMIFKRRGPLFKGKSTKDQLVQITKVLGSDELMYYLIKYGLGIDQELMDSIGRRSRRPWRTFVTFVNAHTATPEALDLLDCILQYDHERRCTAREAMEMSYFDEVRDFEVTSQTTEDETVDREDYPDPGEEGSESDGNE